MHGFCITLAPFEASVCRLTHANCNNLCLYNVNQVNSFQRKKLLTNFSVWLFSPLEQSSTSLVFIAWIKIPITSNFILCFKCKMEQKPSKISHHITPSTILILLFLPFICTNLDLHIHRFYINCLITCLYFSLSALKGGKIRLGRKVKGELQLKWIFFQEST